MVSYSWWSLLQYILCQVYIQIRCILFPFQNPILQIIKFFAFFVQLPLFLEHQDLIKKTFVLAVRAFGAAGIFIKPLFSTSFTCKSISFGDTGSKKIFIVLIVSSAPLEDQCLGIVIEKFLLSSVLSKTELVASKRVIPKSHHLSSGKNIGGLNEKVSICRFGIKSCVCCGLVFACPTGVSVSL